MTDKTTRSSSSVVQSAFAEISRLRDKLRRISLMAQRDIDTGGREDLDPVMVLVISDPTYPLSEDGDQNGQS